MVSYRAARSLFHYAWKTLPALRMPCLSVRLVFACAAESCQFLFFVVCRGRLHTIMVTRDHYLTATAVAQVTGILNFRRKHILIAQPESVFIHKPTVYLPEVSSIRSAAASKPVDRLGQPLRTSSAMPSNLALAAALALQPEASSASRSKTLSNIEMGAAKPMLRDVSGARFSSKPAVSKPALQPNSPRQSAQPAELASKQHRSTRAVTQQPQSAQIEPSTSSLLHARSSEPLVFQQLIAQSDTDDLCHLQQPAAAEADPVQDELSFVMAEDGRLMPMRQREAFATIAEGHQCIITGPAFEYLLKHADPALLETVLHNVAVCARMRSHHKAQLVQLLSSEGLTVTNTRNFKVQLLHFMLCQRLTAVEGWEHLGLLCQLVSAKQGCLWSQRIVLRLKRARYSSVS